ncbi:MAG: TorF family putative porin, partial [Gammaproteobacteria bacterium]
MKQTCIGVTFLIFTTASVTAGAEMTGNVGWDSEYIFRGISQSDSSANGGVDWAHDTGFFLGIWAADVDEGLEVDYYGGFKGQAGDFGYMIGATYYDYT